MWVWGSGNLIQTLLKHHLIDRMHLWVYPITMGTVTNLPVTRSAISAGQANGVIESDGILVNDLGVSYLSPPAHGTATRRFGLIADSH